MATIDSSSADVDVINIHLSCHCRASTSTIPLVASQFPLKASVCHCNLCRHFSGCMFATHAVIPLEDGSGGPDTQGMRYFDTSEHIRRWFCPTCGCRTWNHDKGNAEWEVATGWISGVTYGTADEDLYKKSSSSNRSRGPGSPEGLDLDMSTIDGLLDRVQLWIEPTRDGGGAIWVNGGVAPPPSSSQQHWRQLYDRSTGPPVDDAALQTLVTTARSAVRHPTGDSDNDGADLELHARCACGRIDLVVKRPDTSVRYPAGIDACWSCRLTSGFEITSWATIPAAHFFWKKSYNSTLVPVTLSDSVSSDVFSTYKTSARMTRYFCRGCGVLALAVSNETEWDLATGLVETTNHKNGARVEGWFRWDKYAERNGGVAWIEDALDGGFVAGLVEGVRRDGEGGWDK